MFTYIKHQIKSKPWHREYTLLIALLTIVILLLFGDTTYLSFLLGINFLALVVILVSAFSVIRHADVFAQRLGEPYGSLILSLSVIIVEVSLISALLSTGKSPPTIMRDMLYSLIMLVTSGFLGLSLLLGGRKFQTQHINFAGVTQYLTTIIPLALVILVLPATLAENTFTNTELITIAMISSITYVIFLTIQTKTHQNLFIYEHSQPQLNSENTLDHTSLYSGHWHGFWLVTYLVCVISITKLNAEPLGILMKRLNAPIGLTGLIVAILVFSAEGLGAIRAVLMNDLQKAMNIYFGSILATIALTVPAVIFISLITNQTIILGLNPPDIVLLIGILILCHVTFASGRTNKLDGIAHLIIFMAYIMMLLRT